MTPTSLRVKVKVSSQPLIYHCPSQHSPSSSLTAPRTLLTPPRLPLKRSPPAVGMINTLSSSPSILRSHFWTTPPSAQVPFRLAFPLSSFYHLYCVFQLFTPLTSRHDPNSITERTVFRRPGL